MTFKTHLDELGHHDEIGNKPVPTTSHGGEIGNKPGQITSQDDELGNRPVPITSPDEQIGNEPDGGSLPPDMPTNPTVPLMEDYWVKDGQLWVRFHVLPQTTKYVPKAGPGAPSLDQLEDRRDTYVVKPDDPLVDKQKRQLAHGQRQSGDSLRMDRTNGFLRVTTVSIRDER